MFPTRLSLLGALLLAVSLPTVRAQPSFYHEISLEAMVLNADAVVVGTIVEVSQDKELIVATVAVEETLRGEHKARLSVRFRERNWQLGVGGYDAEELKKLQDKSLRLLVATRDHPPKVFGLVYLTEQKPRTGSAATVRTADLTPLEKPADVLRVAKDTLRSSPGVKRIDTFELTIPIKGGYYFGRGGSTQVAVPVDALLEKKAVQFLTDKERWRRTEGATGLKYFKSEENIARLKELLKDAEPYIQEEPRLGVDVRIYTVRKAAFETLRYWGVAVKEPVFEEKVKRPIGVSAPQDKEKPKAPTFEQVFRAWHAGLSSTKKADREKTLRSMLPGQKDIEYLFPKHADKLWPLIQKHNEFLLANEEKVAKEHTKGGGIKAVEVFDARKDKALSASKGYRRLLAMIPADVGVIECHVRRDDGSGGSIASFVWIKGRWFFFQDIDVLPEALDNLK